jgi:uncharacterized protein (TIGR03083 family)
MDSPDYDTMRLQELGAMSELLHALRPDEWDAQSVCDGWRVRDVIAHICLGYTTPMPVMVAKVGRYGFNVPRASKLESIAYASTKAPDELLAVFDTVHRDRVRKGISKVIKPAEGLVDHTIHHQDIRRPLGRPRTVPEGRLVAALGVIPRLGGFVGAKKRVEGLRLVASDVPWAAGSGLEVVGPGEAILLAASGRAVALPELEGAGVATLRSRMAA